MNDHSLVPRDPSALAAMSYVPLEYVREEASLGQTLRVLWGYRWLSLFIVVIGVAITAAVMTLWPRTYTANASLMVDYEVTDPLNGKELPVGQVSSFIATQVELLQTPAVLRTVAERVGLLSHPDYTTGWTGESGTMQDWVVAKLAKALEVAQSHRGSQLIYITFSAPDRALAARVANTLIDVYQEQDAARVARPSSERAQRYTRELEALQAKAEQAQRKATAFQQRNGLLDDGTRTDVDVLRLAALEERLLAAHVARRAAELRAARDPSVSDEVLASPQVQTLRAQLTTAELRVAQVERMYTPLHSDVREARQQAEDTRAALASAVAGYTANATAGHDVARRLEQDLDRAAAEQRGHVLARARLQDEAARYRLEVAAAQAVYQKSLEGYDQILFSTAGPRSHVGVVSRATPPVAASKPRVMAGMVLGSAAALLLGLFIPLGYERVNRRVRSRDDFARYPDVPVLAEFGRMRLRDGR